MKLISVVMLLELSVQLLAIGTRIYPCLVDET